jgi:hypothetical protein
MKIHQRVVALLLAPAALLAFAAAPALAASDAAHDPHRLSADELRTFLPVVCQGAKKTKSGFACVTLPGYPADGAAYNENTKKASGEITLDAVAYGSFTAKAADEAYLTYSGLEPHSASFGGGILLRRGNGSWKPIRWIPGGQMDHCVALPDSGPQRMLCLGGYGGMGETDSSVSVFDLTPLTGKGDIKRTNVLRAQDGREAAGDASYYCDNAVRAKRDLLLSINDLSRGHEPGVLATSKITTAAAADVRDACAHNTFSDVDTKESAVRYRLVNGAVRVDPAPKFAPVDY